MIKTIDIVNLVGDNAVVRIFRDECLLASAVETHVAMLEGTPVGIWIPKLMLDHDVVRSIVAQQTTPFRCFAGATVRGIQGVEVLSMVWGDFALYDTGLPLMADFYAIPGRLSGLPEPKIVGEAVSRLKEMKARTR
jgi:hypothetical protein